MRKARFTWFDLLVILLLLVFAQRLWVLRAERKYLASTQKTITAVLRVEDVPEPLVDAARNGLGQTITNVNTGQVLGTLVGVTSTPTPVVTRPGGPTGPSRFYRDLDLSIQGPGQVGATVVMLGPAQLMPGQQAAGWSKQPKPGLI